MPAQVGSDQQLRHPRGPIRRDADGLEDVSSERFEGVVP
jgi:hypothetical protein